MRIMIGDCDSDHAAFAVFRNICVFRQVLAGILPIPVVVDLAQIEAIDEPILDGATAQDVHKERTGALHAKQIAG